MSENTITEIRYNGTREITSVRDAETHRCIELSWKCDCGATVYATPGYDTDCERCGQDYNSSAQKLRSNWRANPSNYDDEIGDMEGYEMAMSDY